MVNRNTNRNEVYNAIIAQHNAVIAKRTARLAQIQKMNCSNQKILLWEATKMLEQAEQKKAKFLRVIEWEATTGKAA